MKFRRTGRYIKIHFDLKKPIESKREAKNGYLRYLIRMEHRRHALIFLN